MATLKPRLTGKGNEITRKTGLKSEDCSSLNYGEGAWSPKYNRDSVCEEKGEGGWGGDQLSLTLGDTLFSNLQVKITKIENSMT